jgi:thioredoxin
MAKKVIKFWASFCGPCRVYAPVFERVKQELQNDIEFVEVNVEDDPDNLAGEFKVRGIPLTVVLEDGEKIKEKSGRLSEAELKELILN